MNIISKILKTYKNRQFYKQHIWEHKQNILKAYFEMLKCKDLDWIILDPEIQEKLWVRALEHDDSKFEKEEFEPYRKHYFPIDKNEYLDNQELYSKAWEHHKRANDHHWQARVNWKDEDFDIETELACLENIMDWLAVGYACGDRPYEYYEEHKNTITLPKKQIEFMEKCIYQGIDKKIILERKK